MPAIALVKAGPAEEGTMAVFGCAIFYWLAYMKTKAQKQEELKEGEKLLSGSRTLLFLDFASVKTADLNRLRRELKGIGAPLFVIKKRLLNVLLKEKGIRFDTEQFAASLGTVFSPLETEKVSGPVYKFFASLEIPEGGDTQMYVKKILGGYDLEQKAPIDAAQILFVGMLPPREVLLAQLLGMIAAPIRSFLYLLNQRSETAST